MGPDSVGSAADPEYWHITGESFPSVKSEMVY